MATPTYPFQYLVPRGYPIPYGSVDKEVSLMCAKLKGVDYDGARVPNSDLFVQLKVMSNGSSVEISKKGRMVYVNFFCLEPRYCAQLFGVVAKFYVDNFLGKPEKPKTPSWIHSIPVSVCLLTEDERILCENITVCFLSRFLPSTSEQKNSYINCCILWAAHPNIFPIEHGTLHDRSKKLCTDGPRVWKGTPGKRAPNIRWETRNRSDVRSFTGSIVKYLFVSGPITKSTHLRFNISVIRLKSYSYYLEAI